MDSNNNQIYNKPKNKTLTTKNPESTAINKLNNEIESNRPQFSLMAKDSEWVDILQTTAPDIQSTSTSGDDEIECEDCQMKPLALMFPGLLDKDPEMLEGMLHKLMSTTEITKHLVGHKANFSCMKKVNRLIPTDKKWLDSVTEISTSCSSLQSILQNSCLHLKPRNGAASASNWSNSLQNKDETDDPPDDSS